LFDKNNIKYEIFKDLKTAVDYSTKKAIELEMDNILFSPGSASFDMFKNVYDRCDQF
jgi:UDP-N-acetylmuramoylalanine--D-glutamate ligase